MTNLLRSLLQRSSHVLVRSRLARRNAYSGVFLSVACLLSAVSPTGTAPALLVESSPSHSLLCQQVTGHSPEAQCLCGVACAIPRVDPLLYAQAQAGLRAAPIAAPITLSQTFLLHSRPAATKLIY